MKVFSTVALAFTLSWPSIVGADVSCNGFSDCNNMEVGVDGVCDDGICKPCINGSIRKTKYQHAFCYYPKQLRTFFEARDDCDQLGLKLAEIRDEEKLEAMIGLGIDADDDKPWLGLRCPTGNSCHTDYSQWEWESDGALYNGIGMQKDADGEIIGADRSGDRCAFWWDQERYHGVKAATRHCKWRGPQGALCEARRPMTALPKCYSHSDCDEVDGVCDDGECKPCNLESSRQIQGNFGFCYFNHTQGLNFDDAVRSCNNLGLQLVEPRSDAEFLAVGDLEGTSHYSWIGLTCPAQDDSCQSDFGQWEWLSDGAAYDGNGMRFSNDAGKIVGAADGEFCSHWRVPNRIIKIGPILCTETHPGALCEARPGAIAEEAATAAPAAESHAEHQDIVFLDDANTVIGLTNSDATIDLSHLANDDSNELQELAFDSSTKELSLTQSNVTVNLSVLDNHPQRLKLSCHELRPGQCSKGPQTRLVLSDDPGEPVDLSGFLQELSLDGTTLEITPRGHGNHSAVDLSSFRVISLQASIHGIDGDSTSKGIGRTLTVEGQEGGEQSVVSQNLRGANRRKRGIRGSERKNGRRFLKDEHPVVEYGGENVAGGFLIMSSGRLVGMHVVANKAIGPGRLGIHVVNCTDMDAIERIKTREGEDLEPMFLSGRSNKVKFEVPIDVEEDTIVCFEAIRYGDINTDSRNAVSVVLYLEQ